MNEPLPPHLTRAYLRAILASGTLFFTSHAEKELAADGMSKEDARNVLRGGVPQPGELVNGTWRYQVRTNRFVVVVAFRDEDKAVVVTAWSRN